MNIETIKALCPEFAELFGAHPFRTISATEQKLLTALAEARQALVKYGRHGDCKKADFDYKPCTCGLAEALTPPSGKEG